MRAYRESDLVWVKPIAEKYGEWEAVQRTLGGVYLDAWVVEPLAVICTFPDGCLGYHSVGLTDREGVGALMELSTQYMELAIKYRIPLHTHVMPGTWQHRLFRRLGFTAGKTGTLSLNEEGA